MRERIFLKKKISRENVYIEINYISDKKKALPLAKREGTASAAQR